MPDLRHQSLREPRLPLEYAPLIRKLDRFIHDSRQLKPRKETAELSELAALRAQHDELMAAALAFFGESADDTDLPDSRRSLALGLLRCSYYEETVIGEPPLVDTCGSRTLADFAVDTSQGPQARQTFSNLLCERLDLSETDLADLHETLQPEVDNLRFKQQLMQALETHEPLTDAEDTAGAIWRLFGELYPGHPFLPGEIDVIRTCTSIFFCLPFEGLRLLTSQWDDRTDAERAEVGAFLRRWSKFKQRYYAHFPVFGFFRGDQARPELLNELAHIMDAEVEDIADALTTMVSVLQSSEIDKYIVHDAWGHQWQSLLFRFEETYWQVASYTELPEIDWRPAPDIDSLDEIVRAGVRNGSDTVHQRWDAYVWATVEERLFQSLAGLVAEVLADVVEYKFVLLHPERKSELMSSSFFKDLPTKLDLTLWDIPWYFKLALRGFVGLVEKPEKRAELAAEFPDLETDDVLAVIEDLASRTARLFDFELRRSLDYQLEDDGVVVNMFCRVALNFLAMQATFNEIYEQLQSGPPAAGPDLRRFHDPLVFATASFFELDWREHFWLVDEFLGSHFLPLWDRIREGDE